MIQSKSQISDVGAQNPTKRRINIQIDKNSHSQILIENMEPVSAYFSLHIYTEALKNQYSELHISKRVIPLILGKEAWYGCHEFIPHL